MYPCLVRLLLVLLLALPVSGAAVIIDSGNGTGNVTAPSPDPGWSRVGTRGSLTAVYLGDGWVLTANHVGVGTVIIGGVPYPPLPGASLQLKNPDDTPADLRLFAIDPYPPLPLLPIAANPPSIGSDVILIGYGRDRGARTLWGPDGYEWDPGRTVRWGTNQVDTPQDFVLGSWAFTTVFDRNGSAHEAQAANGDSGGAAFIDAGQGYELAGIMYAIAEYAGQPADTSIYGQITYAADLSAYRDQILDVAGLPEPEGGLAAGLLLLALLSRRRPAR
jgi:hypothetical protein